MTGRCSFDTNILVYACDRAAGDRHERARELVGRAAFADCVLTQQVIGEFLNVGRRVLKAEPDLVATAAGSLAELFGGACTSVAILLAAFKRSKRYQLQFWDSVIITVCLANSVDTLITEDMQDGLIVDGLTILDPFNNVNAPVLASLLAPR